MGLLEDSLAWATAERLDGVRMAAFGVAAIVVGGLLWNFGEMRLTRAVPLPLALAGLLFVVGGASAYFGNQSHLESFPALYEADPTAFAVAEKARVEGFRSLYTGTKIGAALCFLAATVLFSASTNPNLRAVSIGLVLLGLGGFVVDGLSKERADDYYEKILEELGADPSPGDRVGSGGAESSATS